MTSDKRGSEIALGTAFCISSDGKFVTNYHVIEDAYSATITLEEKEYDVDKILAYSEEKDLAILSVPTYTGHKLTLSNKEAVGGEKVFAVGSSEGFTLSVSEGVIASPNREIEDVSFIQHTSPISHGNSGGPLFNTSGEVIGINTLTYTEGQNLNFAINVAEIDSLDYSSPITMADLYEAEYSPFNKLVDFVVSYGTYDYEDSEYEYEISSSSTSIYTLYYDSTDDEISASFFWYYNSYTYDMLTIYIDEVSINTGTYRYMYMDESYAYLSGNITASTWQYDNTLLSVSNYSFSYSDLSSARSSASTSLDVLLTRLETFLPSNVGITLDDLHFWVF